MYFRVYSNAVVLLMFSKSSIWVKHCQFVLLKNETAYFSYLPTFEQSDGKNLWQNERI